MLAPPRAFAAWEVNRRMLFADGTAPTSNGWTAGSSSVVDVAVTGSPAR